MGRRTLLLLASILVAAAGTAMIWVYVQNADARARAEWVASATVLRATRAIDVGAGAAQVAASTEGVPVPRRLVPLHAVTSVQQLQGRAAVVPVMAGQLLVLDQFDAAEAPAGVAPGKLAVTVSLPDPARVSGLLHPGSLVTVYLVDTPTRTAVRRARVLFPTMRVLGVGNTTLTRNARGRPAQIGTQGGVSAGDVILEAGADQAKRIVLAANSGNGSQLWFAVLGDEKAAPRQGDSVDLDQLIPSTSTR